MLLHETVRLAAKRRPRGTAVVSGDQRITYAELDELSNRIAWLLKSAGCEKGDRVGLLLTKSIPAIAGMLGSLRAGAVYVPMDTASPAARLARIIEVCEPKCLLATGATANRLAELIESSAAARSARVGWLDSPDAAPQHVQPTFSWDDLPYAPGNDPGFPARGEDPVHILFTSGSTGVPKGVVITHANVMHFLNWAVKYFGMTSSDRISCHPPLHFDLSMFDIYGTFLAGGELHLVPEETSLLPHKLAEFIRRNELTQWFSVPSVLRYMAQFDVVAEADFPSLKRVLWCGEALPTATLMHWMSRLPGVVFTNLYGPTETTIASSYYTVPRCPESEREEIPIGTACDGEGMVVLDESRQPAQTGEVGELYIHGVGLSPGYWRDPQKTADAFVANGSGRMYRTGDLARLGENGLVYILGRADSQIKSRGYRIELGEIETALNALGVLAETAVVGVHTDGFEGTAICCAYVAKPGVTVTSDGLRSRLAALLPRYMLPSRWMAFDKLPLNSNGKIDRPALRMRFQESGAAVSAGGVLSR